MKLYQELKDIICQKILSGEFLNGDFLPNERELCSEYGMSRITVRKALRLLEEDKLIVKKPGSGNQISYSRETKKTNMDLIALVADLNAPFYHNFMRAFDDEADQTGSLVVFKDGSRLPLLSEDGLLFQLAKRGIKNIVAWSHFPNRNEGLLERLRALGVNLVFFDNFVSEHYADNLGLDNDDAIKQLVDHYNHKCIKKITYFGWQDLTISSSSERREAYDKYNGQNKILIPWTDTLDKDIQVFLRNNKSIRTDAIICENGDLAVSLKKNSLKLKHPIRNAFIGCIDELPEMSDLGITSIKQPFSVFGKEAFRLLLAQNNSTSTYKFSKVRHRGSLIERS